MAARPPVSLLMTFSLWPRRVSILTVGAPKLSPRALMCLAELVALHGDKALLGLDGVADLDYRFGDVANIRDPNFSECHFQSQSSRKFSKPWRATPCYSSMTRRDMNDFGRAHRCAFREPRSGSIGHPRTPQPAGSASSFSTRTNPRYRQQAPAAQAVCGFAQPSGCCPVRSSALPRHPDPDSPY
jgi:hypothetical protein